MSNLAVYGVALMQALPTSKESSINILFLFDTEPRQIAPSWAGAGVIQVCQAHTGHAMQRAVAIRRCDGRLV